MENNNELKAAAMERTGEWPETERRSVDRRAGTAAGAAKGGNTSSIATAEFNSLATKWSCADAGTDRRQAWKDLVVHINAWADERVNLALNMALEHAAANPSAIPSVGAETIDTPEFKALAQDYAHYHCDHKAQSPSKAGELWKSLITYIIDDISARMGAARQEGYALGKGNAGAWLAVAEGLKLRAEKAEAALATARDEGHIAGRRNGVREANADAAETIAELETILAAAREQAYEQIAAHFDATHRELWTPDIAAEIRALASTKAEAMPTDEVSVLLSGDRDAALRAAPAVTDEVSSAVLAGLMQVAERLRKAGASLPAPENKGSVESAMLTGMSIALCLVEDSIATASAEATSRFRAEGGNTSAESNSSEGRVEAVAPVAVANAPVAGLDKLHSTILAVKSAYEAETGDDYATGYAHGHNAAITTASNLVAATQADLPVVVGMTDDDYAAIYNACAIEADDWAERLAHEPSNIEAKGKFIRLVVAALAERQPQAAALAEEVIGCFEAAEVEGLSQVLAETTDGRLKDLVEHRLMYALYAAQAIQQDKQGGDA